MDLPSISVSTHLDGPHQVRVNTLPGGTTTISLGEPGEYQAVKVFCPSLEAALALLDSAVAQCVALQNVTSTPSPVV